MQNILSSILNKNISISGGKYKIRDYLHLLTTSAATNSFIESISKNHKFPNADTLHLKLKNNIIDNIITSFDKVIGTLLCSLPRDLWKVPVVVAIDETYEPFYGSKEKMTPWIFGYKPVCGCIGCYKFAVISIVCRTQKFVIGIVPILVGTAKEEYVSKLIELVSSKITIKHILLDRGFYSAKVFKYLITNKLKFICLCPKNSLTKKYFYQKDLEYSVIHNMKYNNDFSTNKINISLFIIKHYKGYNWLFASNLHLDHYKDYVHFYKHRWGIETTFRVCDQSRIPSKSKHISIRLFLFIFSILLYNLWTFFCKVHMSFSRFLEFLLYSIHIFIYKHSKYPFRNDFFSDKTLDSIFL
jgi:hypothetical protein